MIVHLNSWAGDSFANNTTCEFCGKLASVVVLQPMSFFDQQQHICGQCLHGATEALNRAILLAGCGDEYQL